MPNEELDELGIALSVWGGKFRLLCGECYQEVRCNLRKDEYLNKKGHHRAAAIFQKQGWRFREKALCPKCYRKLSGAT